MPYKDINDQKAAWRRWYYNHKDKERIHRANNRSKIAKKLAELKKTLKCSCGESHPACLDFHHRNPEEKEGCVASFVRYGSWKIVEREIAKCDVLCSNCHRKLHSGL